MMEEGLLSPFDAAMTLQFGPPRDHQGLLPDYPDWSLTREDKMKLLKVDLWRANFLCDLLCSIRDRRIWCRPAFSDGMLLDPFELTINIFEALEVRRRVKDRSRSEAGELLKFLIDKHTFPVATEAVVAAAPTEAPVISSGIASAPPTPSGPTSRTRARAGPPSKRQERLQSYLDLTEEQQQLPLPEWYKIIMDTKAFKQPSLGWSLQAFQKDLRNGVFRQ